ACLVRFESSSVPTTLPTAYDVYPLDGRHDGGYYTVKDCVTIDVLPRTPGNNVYVDRKSGSAGMPRPISYAVFCLKKKTEDVDDPLVRTHVPATLRALAEDDPKVVLCGCPRS